MIDGYLTIISLALVGYEMIVAISALHASLANHHFISKRTREIIVKYLSINLEQFPLNYFLLKLRPRIASKSVLRQIAILDISEQRSWLV